MIFPAHCKHVGYASTRPVGNLVYFLSQYLIREVPEGYEILSVTLDEDHGGLMRHIRSDEVLATPEDICVYPGQVNLHHRSDLIRRALETGKRCTIFRGFDEHMTFVLDPDPDSLLTIHVYDNAPPLPHLSVTLKNLDATGLFGDHQAVFAHHVRDIRDIDAEIFPCRASGFPHTLDADPLRGGERIAGCLTARQLVEECYGDNFTLIDICPLNAVDAEPFIARCCRSERSGIGIYEDRFGAVVHWGATPREIAGAVHSMVVQWREMQ